VSSYLQKYHAVGAHLPGSGEKAILRFFASLDLADWQDLLADISLHQFNAYDVIRPASQDFLVATARALFARLSPQTRALAARALGRLLVRFTRDSERDDQAATELLLMAVSFSESAAAVRTLVIDPEVSRSVRAEAARVLANFDELESFWFRLDYRELPELAPSMVAALATKAPLKGLQLLASLPKQPCPTAHLEYPVKAAIEQLLSSRAGKIVLLRLFNNLPHWATPLFAGVLEVAGKTQTTAQSEAALTDWGFSQTALAWKEVAESTGREEGSAAHLRVRRTDLIEGVKDLLEQWSPSPGPEDVPLETRVQLFERYPSRTALSALIAIGAFQIARLRGVPAGKSDGEHLALLILRAISSHAHIVSMANADKISEPARALLVAYRDLLRSASETKATAPVALEVLLEHGVRPRRLGAYIVRAVASGSLPVSTCHRIVLKFRDEAFVDDTFRAVGEELRKSKDRRLVVAIGTKIYDHSIHLMKESSHGLSVEERCAIPWRSKKVSRLRRLDPGRLLAMPGVRKGVKKR
jgi:hypothetical protein